MTATITAAPTASQWASAALHFEKRDGWRFVRIDGIRYAVIESGTSQTVYTVRADALGCECRWYQKTGQQCSHMLVIELAALESDLQAAVPAPRTSEQTADHLTRLESELKARAKTLKLTGWTPDEYHEDPRYTRILTDIGRVQATLSERIAA